MEIVKSLPELLKQGLETYKSLKEDMQRALGLKQYAKHLSHITQILKEVNEHLDQKEREVSQKLDEAYRLSEKSMDKAVVVVSVIKEQANVLASVLSNSGPGTDHDKLWAACQYFAAFAKDMEGKVTEAEDTLRDASSKLQSTGSDINSIVETLKRVQNQFVAEKKAAQAKARAEAYGGALAGLVAGPIGLIISYSIAADVCEGINIPEIEKDFAKQRETISGYINGFQEMHSETKALKERLDLKRKQLIDLHSKLSTTASVAGTKAAPPLVHFPFLRQLASELVTSCDKFLETCK